MMIQVYDDGSVKVTERYGFLWLRKRSAWFVPDWCGALHDDDAIPVAFSYRDNPTLPAPAYITDAIREVMRDHKEAQRKQREAEHWSES